jgi:3-oxoacyl-[acyl-carrier protein] reductase
MMIGDRSKAKLEGRVAFITGAARGIGQACAITLAQGGADVALCDLLPVEETIAMVHKVGRKCIGKQVDVSKRKDLELFVGEILNSFPSVDILVTCAAVCPTTEILEVNEEEWDKVLAVNVKGTFFAVQSVLAHMIKRSYGKIICIGSLAGQTGGITSGPSYVASKGAIHSLVKHLGKKMAKWGICINCIAPGMIRTKMTREFGYKGEWCPVGRLGDPEDIAGPVLFLASDDSSYMTGAIVNVNGGLF